MQVGVNEMNPNKPNIEGLSDYVGVRCAHPNLHTSAHTLLLALVQARKILAGMRGISHP